MALIFLGQSTCALCGQLLMPGEQVKGLPAISNTIHSLYKYFDSGFHLQCFQNRDKKEEALILIKEKKQKFKSSEYFKEMAAKYGIPKWLEEDD
ncbi:hypothetical protein A4D02_13110 [Niastella koreensis]|uniref:Uncharacterized protein n=2 Tax=Niastella koreensis TaxID=354356 RepID=G8TMB1_NIAKG|nr:hypothetical protein [Niastella koreensis]AEW00893.1 hypothetical protein Niako_4636 [Niastella koreensis GR20-10]OQP42501.1 hypothetical protein A4D02_13110 [Niastella koreensis]